MDCLTSVGEAIRIVRLLIQHFKDISPETNSNRLFLINKMKRDRVQPYPNFCSSSIYPSITNSNFVAELLHYCRAAFAVYGSYESRYTLNHDPFKLPTLNAGRIRKQASRYYKHRNRRFGPTLNGKCAKNTFELNTFSAAMGVSPLDTLYFTTRARYFMPCAAIYLDHRRYEIVVAIRGSYSLADMVTDIFCLSTEYIAPPERFELLVKASSRDKFVTNIDTETAVQQRTNVEGILSLQPRTYVQSQTLKKTKKTAKIRASKASHMKSGKDKAVHISSLYSPIADNMTLCTPGMTEEKKKRYQTLRRKLKSKDLLIKPITDFTKYYGHAGIYAAAAYIYHDTYKILRDTLEKYPNYYLTLTGHSLGGSVSMLMGWFWSYHIPYQRIKVIGFCSPPCGNKSLCDLLSSYGFINVCMQSDFGPRISTKGFLFAFRRLGLLSEISKRRHLRKEFADARHQKKKKKASPASLSSISLAVPTNKHVTCGVVSMLDQPPILITDSDNDGSSKCAAPGSPATESATPTPVHIKGFRTNRNTEKLPRNILSTGDYLSIGAVEHNPSDVILSRSSYKAYDPKAPVPSTPNPLFTDISEYCPVRDSYCLRTGVDFTEKMPVELVEAVSERLIECNLVKSDDSSSTEDFSGITDVFTSFSESSTTTPISEPSVLPKNEFITESELGVWVPGSELATSFAVTNFSVTESTDAASPETKDESTDAMQRFKKIFAGELKRLKEMSDKELKQEYTAFTMDYSCPDEDINTYVPGIQYVISFNYGNKISTLKDLIKRQKELGVENYSVLRIFSAPPEIFNELIFDSEMFDHHLLIYQWILLLYYNLLGVYLPIPLTYTSGGPVKKYPIICRSEDSVLHKK
ncbi:Hypothetical protein GLP15_198 [Giardia lamblia P15]|uniref:sn-1-specific diacylglycerol lipase n=1 Tax=Giardia intestinalis (strain P15) TaxID=658858 RepID=E1F1G9_GIAIA|nr:Hypothetical protein GLP15_198 [Giardia lamblia P15]